VRRAIEACIGSILELLFVNEAFNKDEESIQLAIDLGLQSFAGWMFERTHIESEVRRLLEKA